jgi:hypothetical protein
MQVMEGMITRLGITDFAVGNRKRATPFAGGALQGSGPEHTTISRSRKNCGAETRGRADERSPED